MHMAVWNPTIINGNFLFNIYKSDVCYSLYVGKAISKEYYGNISEVPTSTIINTYSVTALIMYI